MNSQILIVDDIEANLISLSELLLSYDNSLNIISANSGEKALEYSLSKDIGLIILDIQMPTMDGFEVAKYLKMHDKTRDIPIIFLTAAFKSEEFVQRGFYLGAVDYLTKPVNEYQLINRVSLYLKLIKQVEENRKKDQIIFQQSKLESMSDMLSNIAHQWRQPLSAISTISSSIKLKQELNVLNDSELVNDVESIISITNRLSLTIENFKDFFTKDTTVKECFMLDDFFNSTLKIFEDELEYHQINIFKTIENIPICTIENQLAQVILTMLKNSEEALSRLPISNNKNIFIIAKKENKSLIIEIKDNAGGIPKEIVEKIFEPYFTTKHQSQGTGLGLYMANEIVTKNLKGTIRVENKNFNHEDIQYFGAIFKIEIPLN